MSDAVLVTVLIPVKDEQDNVARLAAEITAAFAPSGWSWEALWVDDGSTDGTAAALRALGAPHRMISLVRNVGQSAALMAGAEQARGIWLATLDGDGQNDPADLPGQLRKALAEDLDMVNGIRARRNDDWRRKLASRFGNAVRNWMTGRSVTDVGCSTRVLKRAFMLRLPFFHGMHRFLPALMQMKGARMAEIPVNHRPRQAGRSKYGAFSRGFTAFRDLFGVRWLQARNRVWTLRE